MTAALTLIKYSDENKAEIEFYNRDDWNSIEENNKEYEKEYKKALEEAKEEAEKKGRIFNKERFKFEDVDSILKGSHEIYKNFKENHLDKNSLGEIKTIKINDKKNILEDLKEYVGSKGKYTPLVKMTTLYINDERIKDYIIVDTPGTNDPIISRGQKTKEFLGKCDYIIFLSYSSQFLDNNDNAYIKEQLPAEGIRDILILASKFDNQLSQESVFEDADGDIKVAYEEEKRKLSRKLNRWSEEFKKDKNPLDLSKSELEFQSTMLYRIYKNFDNLSGIEKEIFNRLEEDYNNSTFTKELLKDLSGMPAVEKKISNILVRKEEIMKNAIEALLDGKRESLSKILEKIRKGFEERKFELSDVGIKDVENKINNLQEKITSLSFEIKNSVKTERENFDKKLKDEISKISNTKDRYSSLQKQSRSYEEEVDIEKGWGLLKEDIFNKSIQDNLLIGLNKTYLPQVPVLIYHGTVDEIIPIKDPHAQYQLWCDWGIESLEFAEDLLTGHLAETFTGAPAALAWIDARFDGKTPIQGCLHTTRLTNLLYPNTSDSTHLYFLGIYQAVFGTPLGPGINGDNITINSGLLGLVSSII